MAMCELFQLARAIDLEQATSLFREWLSCCQQARGKRAKECHTALKTMGIAIAVFPPDHPDRSRPTRPRTVRY